MNGANTPIFLQNYKNFRRTQDVLSQVAGNVHYNATVDTLNTYHELEKLSATLIKQGFKRLNKNISHGRHAIVLEANNHQMIRIIAKGMEETYRLEDTSILQPLGTIDTLSGYHIEILPKIHTLDEIVEDDGLAKQYGFPSTHKERLAYAGQYMRRLIVDNLKHGNFFYDPDLSNAAIIKDDKGFNTPVIIDAGSVVKYPPDDTSYYTYFALRLARNNYSQEFNERFPNLIKKVTGDDRLPLNLLSALTKLRLERAGRKFSDYLIRQSYASEMPYAQAQAAHLKSLGLEKGKISGLWNDPKYKHLAVPSAIIQDNLYPDEAAGIIKSVVDELDKVTPKTWEGRMPPPGTKYPSLPEGVGFCGLIRQKQELHTGRQC